MFERPGGELGFGVAIDTSDLVYVSEHNNHCVSVFTSAGRVGL
jgi:hypothetical protein